MPFDLTKISEHHKTATKGAPVCVKAAVIKTPTVDREARIVQGLVSTVSPDMDNEVVLASGMSRRYFPKSIQAVYLNHDYGFPVGKCVNLSTRDGGTKMFATTYILPTALGEDVLTAVEHGAMSGFSIGFMPEDRGPPTPEECKQYGKCETITRKGMLLEYSITAMPTNPEALIDLARKSLIHRSSALAFGLPDGTELQMPDPDAGRRMFFILNGRAWSKG